MSTFSIFKAVHIIFVVTWFAGLFYIYRLFIYHTEAQQKSDIEKNVLSEQFKIMQSRLWLGITWPSAIITMIMGINLLYLNSWFLSQLFFQIKLLFLFGLYVYQFYTHYVFRKLQNNEFVLSSNQLRILNEVATIFLIAIVFIIELQSSIYWMYAILGLLVIVLLLLMAIKLYKKIRKD